MYLFSFNPKIDLTSISIGLQPDRKRIAVDSPGLSTIGKVLQSIRPRTGLIKAILIMINYTVRRDSAICSPSDKTDVKSSRTNDFVGFR